MEPYYDYMSTHGTVNSGAGVNRNGTQFFGSPPDAPAQINLPKKLTLLQLIQEPTINLWGMGGTPEEDAAAAAAAAAASQAKLDSQPKLLSFEVAGGLAVSFVLGRFVAVPLIEYFSTGSLSDGQKTAIGVTAMIF
jgi:hypothetical protein